MFATAFVGNVPKNYDAHLGPFLFEPYARQLAETVAAHGPETILELACGTGIVTKALIARLPHSKLTSTDLNGPMVEVARSKFPTGIVNFEVVDAQALPFEDASFDAVVCQFGVMFFPDKLTAMQEARRVLRPGGLYAFNVWDCLEANTFCQEIKAVVQEAMQPDSPRFLDVPYGFNDRQVIRELVETAGFTQIEVQTITLTSSCQSAESAAEGILRGTPLFSELDGRADVSIEALKPKIVERLAKRFGDRPMVAEIQALVCTGVKP